MSDEAETDPDPVYEESDGAAAVEPVAAPADPWDFKKDGKDPWRRHPLAGPASVLFLLALLYLITAGWVYGKYRDDENATWVKTYFAPADFVRSFSGMYFSWTEWQIRDFEEVDELLEE
jgi:hypothetical protein